MDTVPEGQSPPEWAQQMIARALAFTSRLHPVDEHVVALVAADLMATLGWTAAQADEIARAEAQAPRADAVPTAFEVAEEVQQWLHDTFLDTTWPACPEHGQHPLWLDDESEPMWTCAAIAEPVCALGQLGTVMSVDDATATVNRQRLDQEIALTLGMIERFRKRWE